MWRQHTQPFNFTTFPPETARNNFFPAPMFASVVQEPFPCRIPAGEFVPGTNEGVGAAAVPATTFPNGDLLPNLAPPFNKLGQPDYDSYEIYPWKSSSVHVRKICRIVDPNKKEDCTEEILGLKQLEAERAVKKTALLEMVTTPCRNDELSNVTKFTVNAADLEISSDSVNWKPTENERNVIIEVEIKTPKECELNDLNKNLNTCILDKKELQKNLEPEILLENTIEDPANVVVLSDIPAEDVSESDNEDVSEPPKEPRNMVTLGKVATSTVKKEAPEEASWADQVDDYLEEEECKVENNDVVDVGVQPPVKQEHSKLVVLTKVSEDAPKVMKDMNRLNRERELSEQRVAERKKLRGQPSSFLPRSAVWAKTPLESTKKPEVIPPKVVPPKVIPPKVVPKQQLEREKPAVERKTAAKTVEPCKVDKSEVDPPVGATPPQAKPDISAASLYAKSGVKPSYSAVLKLKSAQQPIPQLEKIKSVLNTDSSARKAQTSPNNDSRRLSSQRDFPRGPYRGDRGSPPRQGPPRDRRPYQQFERNRYGNDQPPNDRPRYNNDRPQNDNYSSGYYNSRPRRSDDRSQYYSNAPRYYDDRTWHGDYYSQSNDRGRYQEDRNRYSSEYRRYDNGPDPGSRGSLSDERHPVNDDHRQYGGGKSDYRRPGVGDRPSAYPEDNRHGFDNEQRHTDRDKHSRSDSPQCDDRPPCGADCGDPGPKPCPPEQRSECAHSAEEQDDVPSQLTRKEKKKERKGQR